MHYFLNISRGDDLEGVESQEFADLSRALEAAAESACDLLIEMLRQRRPAEGGGSYVEITDEAGAVMASVELGGAAVSASIERRSKFLSFH